MPIFLYLKEKQVLSQPTKETICPDGGIGRRAGLKHQWIHLHAGSTPALGTIKIKPFRDEGLFLFTKILDSFIPSIMSSNFLIIITT